MMSEKTIYSLQEVTTPQLEQEFLDMANVIYQDDENWVRPLDDDIRKVFSRKDNPLFKGGEAVRWIARDMSGTAVGRIAAFYNDEQSRIEEQPTGGCGFFESINNQQVANLLFDAARLWLKDRGMEAMDGPINFGPRDSWWGLLVEGFTCQPLYSNPYNPSYYKSLFENYGFQNYFNQNTYIWRVNDSEANQQIFARAERLMTTPGYHFETINMNRLEQAAEDFRLIYNRAWASFSGVKPMEKMQAQQLMRSLKLIIDPNIIIFAYYNEEPIGFFVTVPDLNRIIGKFNGQFGIWQKIQLMWKLKIAKSCDRIFGIIFGIAPEYHGKGVESGIMCKYWHFLEENQSQYKTMELAWIGDFNPVMNRMIQKYVCASLHKVHTTYRYLFDRNKEFHRCPRLGVRKE
jgi:hypothetical protein